MAAPHKFILDKQTLWLSSERCILWENQRALILSDLHFGKSGHFRKSGIGVPQNVFKEDLQRLFSQIQYFNPEQLLIVGDFFHSSLNKEVDMFLKWRNDFPHLKIYLIKGNHDILTKKFYADANISVTSETFAIENFCFTHDINTSCNSGKQMFTFSGHVHPGIKISGAGKQQLYFPCFYFTKNHAILPAFSRFTGLSKVRPKEADKVFMIVENNVVKLQ